MVVIKLSEVILFPYIIGRFQKKFRFLNSRVGVGVGVGSKVPTRPAFRTGRVGQDIFSLGVKMTKNTHDLYKINFVTYICILNCTLW